MTRRIMPPESKLTRSKKPLRTKKIIHIICEGEVTEPSYLDWFANWNKVSNLEISIIPRGGPIRTLVDKVQKESQKYKTQKKCSDDIQHEVWGIADIDEHPKKEEAINLAKELKLNLIISNPCFEIWGVFHFEPYSSPRDRHFIQRYLKKGMPSYDHKDNPIFEYQKISSLESYAYARKNAIASLESRSKEGTEKGNPSTNIFELLDIILSPANQKKIYELPKNRKKTIFSVSIFQKPNHFNVISFK